MLNSQRTAGLRIFWPPRLSAFAQLLELDLFMTDFICDYSETRTILRSLPMSLRILRLKSSRSLAYFLQAQTQQEDSASQDYPCHLDFAQYLPNLEELCLSQPLQVLPFGCAIFDYLPTRLHTLEIRGKFFPEIDYGIINKLPRTLTSLSIGSEQEAEFAMGRSSDKAIDSVEFPPNLTYLNLVTNWTRDILGRLPQSLETLVILKTVDLWDVDSEELISPSPATDDEVPLCFNGPLTLSMVEELPSQLKNLYGAFFSSGYDFFSDSELKTYLEALPRTLVKYRVPEHIPIYLSSALPPFSWCYEDTSTWEERQTVSQDFFLMPRHLVRFDCVYSLTNEHIANLPRTLTHLCVWHSVIGAHSEPIKQTSWPPGLAELKMHPTDSDSVSKRPNIFLEGDLPLNMTALKLNWAAIAVANHGEFLGRLNSLQDLHINGNARDLDEETWQCIPKASQILSPSLLTLEARFLPIHWISDLGHLSRLRLLKFSYMPGCSQGEKKYEYPKLTTEFLASLPRALETLLPQPKRHKSSPHQHGCALYLPYCAL